MPFNTMFCKLRKARDKQTNKNHADREELIVEIHSRVMISINGLLKERITEILKTGQIDDLLGDKMNELWDSGSLDLDDSISSGKDKEEKKKEVSTTKTESTSTKKDKCHIISYDDALKELGGEKSIINHKGISDDIQLAMKDNNLCKEIDNLLPPTVDRLAKSIRNINQSYVNNIDAFYEQAEKAYPKFEERTNKFADLTKSEVKIADLKSRDRATNKAHFKYRDGNDKIAYYRLNDIVRGTLIYENIPDLYNGLKESMQYFDVKELNDCYQEPFAEGYRDIQLVVNIDGFMCELQLTTSVMLQAKATSGHRNYEFSRQVVAGAKYRNYDQVKSALKFGKDQLGSSVSLFGDGSCRLLAHEAAKSGDVDILDLLMDSGADIDTQDDDGNTPLHHAIVNGHESCVWLLINKYKCDVNIKNDDGETPLVVGYVMLYTGKLWDTETLYFYT